MARLLGEARVSILPDGTRFKPETEATVKKAVAGMQAKVRISANEDELIAKLSAAEVAIHKVIDKQYDAKFGIEESKWNLQVAKLKTQLETLSNKSVKIETAMDLAKFNEGVAKVIAESDGMAAVVKKNTDKMAASQAKVGAAAQAAADKEVAAYTKAAALSEIAQTKAMDRIRKAREADILAEQKGVETTKEMYARLFDQIGEIAKATAESSNAEDKSLKRIMKAREADMMSQQKGIDETKKMYSKMFDELNKRDKVKVNVDGTLAEVETLALREKIKAMLKDIKAKVRVDNGSLKTTASDILGFFGGNFRKRMEESGKGNGNAFGSGFIGGLGKSALMQNPGITAAVIAGMAALPAAVGAVGVLGGIALGAGLMFGAEKMIKSQLKSTTAAMKTLQTQMGGKPTSPSSLANQQLGILSTQNTITQLSNNKKLTAAQQGQLTLAKQRLAVQQQSLAAAKQQGQGTAAQQASMQSYQREIAMLQKEMQAYAKINNAMSNLKQQFLDFARVATLPLIAPFTDAINALSDQLGPSGPLTKNFTSLFKAVGPLVKPVEISLFEIVKGILPGLTDMLNRARKPLSEMFITFGKVVGLKLGQWFREAIPYIKDSATYLNKLIGLLGDVGVYLIKFGGEVAKAFAGKEFQGFGPLLRRIADDLIKILVPAFEGFSIVLAPVSKYILGLVADFTDFLAKNPGVTKAIFATIAAYLLLSKALKIVDIALAITDALEIGGVWALVAIGVVAAAILIIKYWKPIASFFTMIWKHIWSGFVGPLINFFTQTIPHAFGVTLDWIKKHFPLIAGIIAGPFGLAVALVIKYHKQIFSAIASIWGHIENVVTGVVKPIVSVIVGAWREILKITKPIWNGIVLAIKIPALIVLGLVGELVIGVRNLFNMVWPYIYRFTKSIWGHIENAITGVVKPIVSVVVGGWNNIKANTAAVWNWLYRFTKNIWGHVENLITGIVKPTASVVVGAWNWIRNATSDVWNWIFNFTKNIWGHIENFITGIVKPIQSVIHGAWNNIKTWTADAWNWVYQHIVSPLSKASAWISKHFVTDVEGAFKGLVSTVEGIWNKIKGVVAAPINFVIKSIWNPFAGFVNRGLGIFGIKDKLPMGSAIKLARGGGVPGYAPGSDTVPAMLSPGEYVLNPTAARAIGHRKLDAINAAAKPGGGQHMVKSAQQHFASGGDVVNDAEKWNGHKYVWGGGSNPASGWDCSSFVNYIVGHDFKLNLPGGGSWAQETNGGSAHGPTAAMYNNWNYGRHVGWSDAKKGDLAIENNGQHIGFVVQDNTTKSGTTGLQGFAARSTATGTGFQEYFPNAFHLVRFADDRGFISQAWQNTGGAVLKAAAQFALSGISNLLQGPLNHIPGTGPIPKIAKAGVEKVISSAKNALTGNQNNYSYPMGAYGPQGTGTSAGEMGNGRQLYSYLLNNLFNGDGIAAAGATASIWGESMWNPFAQGTGGRGLIGWTPPSTISDSAFRGGMATQLPAILQFVSKNGDMGAIAQMESVHSVFDAANIWGRKVERFGINDVHPEGVNLATQIMNASNAANQNHQTTFHPLHKASGGLIPGFAHGGAVNTAAVKQAQAAKAAAAKKVAAAAAKKAAAADAHRVAKLEMLPLATLKARAAHYNAKLAHDTHTGNYRDYYGTTLALDDVNKAIKGWISPLQREHDTDAKLYRKYAGMASKDKASGNARSFMLDSVKAAKYAAAIAKIDKALAGQASAAAGASSFVPLNIPLNRDYMTGFGSIGGQFRLGGTLPEGIIGRGVKSGMSYMMGAGERVVPPNSTAANPGNDMAQTNQLLLSLLTELRTANQINKVTAQNTQNSAKSLGSAGRGIL